MRMTHYSGPDFRFDPSRRYDQSRALSGFHKPDGLWLSYEQGYGWSDWNRDNYGDGWMGKKGDVPYPFRVDRRRLLEINGFPAEHIRDGRWPWEEIFRQYSGMLVFYQSGSSTDLIDDLESGGNMHWYWMMDCDSAVVWDLSAATPLPG